MISPAALAQTESLDGAKAYAHLVFPLPEGAVSNSGSWMGAADCVQVRSGAAIVPRSRPLTCLTAAIRPPVPRCARFGTKRPPVHSATPTSKARFQRISAAEKRPGCGDVSG
jgi:hypothetical protein